MPKIVDRDQMRMDILMAFQRCIDIKPIDTITLRDIAAEAGMAHPTLLHYFRSKDELILEYVKYTREYMSQHCIDWFLSHPRDDYDSNLSYMNAFMQYVADGQANEFRPNATTQTYVLGHYSEEIGRMVMEEFREWREVMEKCLIKIYGEEAGKNEAEAWNYAQYGFNDLMLISAEHGDHISDLADAITERCDFSKVKVLSSDRPIKIAILGKPNTGKSTLSNRLTHSENSIVCDYAGTTRDVVEGEFEYAGRRFKVLDTAGIRRKARVHDDVEYYSVNRAIKTLDECDVVFLMIDAVEGLAEQDKKICSLAFEKGRGIIFVLNKWDLREEKDNKAVKSVREWMNIMFAHMDFAPILPLSALEGKGIKDLLNTAIDMYGQLTKKIGTSSLNNALQDWLERYPPPASKTAHFKIRYMTQASVNPVSFIIFATRPEVVPEPYVTYLKNRIREDLGYDQIPVQVEFKGSRQKWEDRER